ncbi:amino acid ABC transporter permease [Serinibacter salmoneus]|uniref:Amino acid ABC transporter membrane protein 2 (PAAT family) n=1 Tax=Serinibacter salmoneus TaxID=556530 RepID=A0A2A9CZD2_9MICO|nr:amino acid ABC transporter permease [Serinibacter salmoneus]PFG19355.1 amino acid ABC transporter membrane protein 2 (PAAT family) [Serinibacter salmoneus]
MSAQVLFDAPGPKGRRNMVIVNIVGAIVVIGIAVLVLIRFGQTGQLEADRWTSMFTANAWMNFLIPGLRNTLIAAALSIVFSMLFGIVFGLGRLTTIAPLRWISGIVVEFFRAVPVLIMMVAFWLGFGYAQTFDPNTVPLVAVVLALTLYNGSVIAELVRSGVFGLPKGQREAAAAIGMTHSKSLRLVELPQALIAMLPSLVSQFVVILKDSALGSWVTYNELLFMSRLYGSGNGNMLQALIVAALIFILLNWMLTKLADYVAKRLSSRTAAPVHAPDADVQEEIEEKAKA